MRSWQGCRSLFWRIDLDGIELIWLHGSRSLRSQTQGSTRLLHRILHRRIVIGTAATVILGAFLMLSSARDGAWMPQDTLLVALATGTAPRVLDVRTTREFAAGHVPGAIHVPYHQLWLRRTDLPADKTNPMVIYCSHGPRAGMAKLQRWTLGYQDVRYLEGQMSGWTERGLPLTTGRAPPKPEQPRVQAAQTDRAPAFAGKAERDPIQKSAARRGLAGGCTAPARDVR